MKPIHRVILVGLALLAVSGCGSLHIGPGSAAPTSNPVPADSAAGVAACNQWDTSRGSQFQLVAEFDSTAGTVAAWAERLYGATGYTSPWRQYAPTMAATVCYFDGPWAIPCPPPLPPATPAALHRDEAILLANGLQSMGPYGACNTDLAVERPSG